MKTLRRTASFLAILLLPVAFACAGGSGAPGSGDDDDDGSTPDERLLPLEEGRTWTYDVTMLGSSSVCAAGIQTESVTGAVTVGGRSAFEVDSFCAAAGVSSISVAGNQVELYYSGDWIEILDEPIEEGHTWTSTGPIQYSWSHEGSVTVPAGTFEGCWMREQIVSYVAYSVFCPGVGMVHDVSQDLNGNGWDASLQSRSF